MPKRMHKVGATQLCCEMCFSACGWIRHSIKPVRLIYTIMEGVGSGSHKQLHPFHKS